MADAKRKRTPPTVKNWTGLAPPLVKQLERLGCTCSNPPKKKRTETVKFKVRNVEGKESEKEIILRDPLLRVLLDVEFPDNLQYKFAKDVGKDPVHLEIGGRIGLNTLCTYSSPTTAPGITWAYVDSKFPDHLVFSFAFSSSWDDNDPILYEIDHETWDEGPRRIGKLSKFLREHVQVERKKKAKVERKTAKEE